MTNSAAAPGRTVVTARIHAIGDLNDGLAFMMGLSLDGDGTGGFEHDAKFGYGFCATADELGLYLVFGLGAGGVGINGDDPMPLPYKGYALIEGALQIISDSEDRNWILAGGYNWRRGGESFPWGERRMGSGDDMYFSTGLRFWMLERGPLLGLVAGFGF